MQKYRQSHESPSVKKLYEVFLKEPLGHKSHELLHTHYVNRGTELPHKEDEHDICEPANKVAGH